MKQTKKFLDLIINEGSLVIKLGGNNNSHESLTHLAVEFESVIGTDDEEYGTWIQEGYYDNGKEMWNCYTLNIEGIQTRFDFTDMEPVDEEEDLPFDEDEILELIKKLTEELVKQENLFFDLTEITDIYIYSY